MPPSYPSTIIPFSEFIPDKALFANPGLVVAENCVPLSNTGFVPAPVLELLSAAITGTGIQGSLGIQPAVGTVSDADYHLYVGSDDDKLYEIAPQDYGSATAWVATDRSKGAGTYTVDSWFFHAFGRGMVAAPGLGDALQLQSAVGNAFADLVAGGSPATPLAKYVTSIRNRLVLGNVQESATNYPNRVWWSVINDITTYTDPSTTPGTTSNYEDLEDDYGDISGLVSGTDYAHIFKRKASYRMMYGGPFGISFLPVGIGHGTVYPHSVTRLGGQIFFWGPAGPTMINEQLQVVPLGLGSFSRSLQDEDWFLDTPISINRSSSTEVYATADPTNHMVLFLYDATDAGRRILFVYNARHGRGSILRQLLPLEEDANFLPLAMAYRPPQPTWPWNPLRDLLVIGTDSGSPKIGAFNGDSEVLANFRTGYQPLTNGTTSRIIGVKPIASLNAKNTGIPEFQVNVRTISQPWETSPSVTAGNSIDNADTNGYIRLPNSVFGRYHSIELQTGERTLKLVTEEGTLVTTETGAVIILPAGGVNAQLLAEIEGVEVLFEEGPEYGK